MLLCLDFHWLLHGLSKIGHDFRKQSVSKLILVAPRKIPDDDTEIKKVFYKDSYAKFKGLISDEGVDFLRRFGVEVIEYKNNKV